MSRVTRPRPIIGVFGIGLEAYWDQFPGLKERLQGYQQEVERRLQGFGGELVSAGLVDTPARARQAGDLFAQPAEFMDRWCAQGPTHHVALGIGHQLDTIEKVGRLLNLESTIVAR